MTTKNLFFKIHQYIGIVSGAILTIVALTGAIWGLLPLIESFTDGYKNVEPIAGQEIILPSKAGKVAQEVFPEHSIYAISYEGAKKAIQVSFYDRNPRFYRSVFVHPYSGQVIKVVNHNSPFFQFVLQGHRALWIPNRQIASIVVGGSMFLFLIIIISGVAIWLPRNWKYAKKKLRFSWRKNTNLHQKMHSLHLVLGIYLSVFALIFALTGTIISFSWVRSAVYSALGGEKSLSFELPTQETNTVPMQNTDSLAYVAMNKLLPTLSEEEPSSNIRFNKPRKGSQLLQVGVAAGDNFYNTDYRFFNINTMAELEATSIYGRYKDADAADKFIRMNYEIHIGSVLGVWGRILAIIASLLIASLPVTGYYLWWRKSRLKRQSRRKKKLNQN